MSKQIQEREIETHTHPPVDVDLKLAVPSRFSGTVLLVDDDPAVRDIMTHLLSRMGLQVFAAASGAEALRQFDAHSSQIQVVISDFSMPGMNGLELAKILGQRNPQLKKVLMSGLVDESVLRGQDVILLPKPFSRETLHATIYSLIHPDACLVAQ